MNHQLPDKVWVSARHMQYFLALGETLDLPLDDLLEAAGIERACLTKADGRVPVAALERLLELLDERFDLPLIGLQLAAKIEPATFGVLGFLTQTCTVFDDVLGLVENYNGLLINIGQLSLCASPEVVSVRWECHAGGRLFRQHASDYVLASFAILGRALLAGNGDFPLYVNLAHRSPARPALLEHYQALFHCPVYFDKAVSELVLPAELRRRPLCQGEALMREVLERHTQPLLVKRSHRNLVGDTRELIAAMLTDTPPGKEAVAEQLGMSGRSLHRLLKRFGTRYQTLLDEVRFTRAEQLLSDPQQGVEAVALRVGFQSRQSFIRWFRHIEGCTPGEYRRFLASVRRRVERSNSEK